VKLTRLVPLVVTLAVSWSCSSSSSSTTSPSPATVSSVAVSGIASLSNIGQTVQLTATATFSDGTTQNVTATATWQSSNSSVATVSSGGLVTAVTSGTVTMTATFQGKAGTATVPISITSSSRNTMSATIDGTSWVAITVSAAKGGVTSSLPSGVLSVGGANSFTGPYVDVTVAVPAVVGTYAVNSSSAANAGLQIPNSGASWVAGPLGGSGTITLATLTATGATGTFSLTLVPLTGTTATGNKVVTNGMFNVTL
jgi:hypothetical protein